MQPLLLKKILLTNYRQFEREEIVFPEEGLIGILGKNGTGKSTVVEAIVFALFGTAKGVTRTSKEGILRDTAPASSSYGAELVFESGGETYLVNRTIISGHVDAKLWCNKKPVAFKTTDVNEAISKMLGMGFQSFSTSVYCKQKELNALSGFQPNKRKKIIMKMLGIHDIDASLTGVRKDKREISAKIEGSRSMLVKDGRDRLDIMVTERFETYNKLIGIDEELSELMERIELNNNELNGISKDMKQLDIDHDRYRRLTYERKGCEKEGHELNKRYQELKRYLIPLENHREEFTGLKDFNDDIDVLDILIMEKRDKITRRSILTSEMEKLDIELEGLQSHKQQEIKKIPLKGARKELTEAEVQLEQCGVEKKKLLKRKGNVAQDGKCPVCLKFIGDDYDTIISHYANMLKKNEDANGYWTRKIKKMAEIVNIYENREEEYAEWVAKKERIGELESVRVERKSEIDGYLGIDVEGDRKKLKQMRKDHERYIFLKNKINELERYNMESLGLDDRIDKIGEEISNYDRTLDEINFDMDSYSEKMNEITKVKMKLDKKKSRLFELEKEKAGLDSMIIKMDDDIVEMKALKNKSDFEVDKLSNMECLAGLMDNFRLSLIGRVRPLLSGYASIFIELLTSDRYSRVEIDEKYDVLVYDKGHAYDLSRFSGGEQDITNLCVRLAISQIISEQSGKHGAGFIILDEIFGSVDEERRESIINALHGLSNRYQQIICISHIPAIHDFMTHRIEIGLTDDGIAHCVLR